MPSPPSDSAGWVNWVRHVRHLIPFALVGLSGLLVNSAILAAATRVLGLGQLMISTVLATAGSTVWNFTFTEVWVFRERRRPGWQQRLVMFFVMNNAALLLRGPMIYDLTFRVGIHYLISNGLSIGAVTLVRYFFSEVFIWRGADRREPPQSANKEQPLG